MIRNKTTSAAALAVVFVGCGVAQANAQTFALFSKASFEFIGGEFESYTPVGYQPTFTFREGPLAGTTVKANVSLTAWADGPATVSPGSPFFGDTVRQNLKNLTATFTAVKPINGKTDLLTVTGSAASILGYTKSRVDAFDATGVTFKSDFWTFGGTNELAFSFVATKPWVVNSTGTLQNFVDPGSGSGNALGSSVPEPGTVSLLVGLAVTGSGFGLRRLRRRSA